MGGLSKKAFQFEKISAQEKLPTLIVDAGSLLFKHTTISTKQAEQEKITAYGIVESYGRMGYEAVGVAREDLIAGLNFFLDITKASTFPWVSANFMDSLTKQPLVHPYVIVQKGDITVGITALTATNVYKPFNEDEHVVILPWQEIFPAIVQEMTGKCDIIFLLSNLPAKENREITEAYPDIDLIIQAGVDSVNQAPQLLNKTLICQTGKQGKQIGIMNVSWQNTPWGSDKQAQLDQKRKSLDRLLWQLSKFEKFKEPLVELQGDPNQLHRYKNLLTSKEEHENDIEKLTSEIANQQEGKKPSTFTNRFIAMQTSLPNHEEVQAIVEKTKEEINKIGKKQISRENSEVSNFIGSENCTACHEYQASSWEKSPHARAYTTLENKSQQFNLDCLPCHITGDGDIDKGDAIHLSKSLQGVGCENCHGPGRHHAQNPEKIHLSAKLSDKTCLQCHTDDHDDSFEFVRDVQKMNCVEN